MKFNVLIGIILFIICILISIGLTNKLSLRRKVFEDLLDFNNKIEVEIKYTKRTIIEICTSFNGLIKDILNNYLLNKKEIDFSNYSYLKTEDISLIKEYLSDIGKYDGETQLNVLKAKNAVLSEKYDECKLKEEKLKPLYIKLGFLSGLILFIILI